LTAGLLACALLNVPGAQASGPDQAAAVRRAVDEAMKPIIAEHGLPGLAVAVTIDGQRHFVEYGLASRTPEVPVTRDTIFELGSISKTFMVTLTALAEVEGKLSLSDSVTKHVPDLKGSALDQVRLVELATHTAGGFPLQVPDEVKSEAELTAYFRAWTPQHPPGARRVYANPSIGLLGVATARAFGQPYATLMERRLFPELGLRRTYIDVPAAEMGSYAWGTNRDGKPVRVNPGPLASEAYGIKSNAVDMIRFLEANMGVGSVPAGLARALSATHVGYYRAGEMIQDLVWEHYPWPVALERIVAGNTPPALLNAPATAIEKPVPAQGDVFINKTGSTGGFGAYAAFIPGKRIGIVMLANKFYPNAARVKAAHAVLSRLTE
jgi:beta-lactamase class C